MASTDEQLTRYLLGELPEAESAPLEEEYFADDASFERLLAVENELVDDYARGALPASQRAQLERRLRETGHWGRVQFARALSQRLAAEAQTPRGAGTRLVVPLVRRRQQILVGALAAAVLVLAGLGWWFSSRIAALRGELARNDEQQRSLERRAQELQQSVYAERAEKEAAIQRLNEGRAEAKPPETKTSKTARFLLIGTVRSSTGPANRVRLTPDLESVVLQVPGEENPYPAYRGTLRTARGKSLLQAPLRSSSSRKDGTTLDLAVPSRLLAPGRYVLAVEGRPQGGKWEPIRDYPFNVIGK